MDASPLHPWRIVLLSLGVGIFFTAQTDLMTLSSGRPLSIEWDVVQELLFWCVWAALSPLILVALRRWPLGATPLPRPLAVHALIAATLAPAQTCIAFGLHLGALGLLGTMSRDGARAWILQTRPALVWGVFMGVFFYWVIVGAYTAVLYRRRSATLESALAQAQLDALRSQLRPHFLFNTLNAIAVLTVGDADKARAMLVRLGSLLRRSLDEEQHEVPLHKELAFLNEYLDIQRMRFGDKLSVSLTIDPAVVDARVPVLLLQPVVENAIQHGASDDDGRTTITVHAARTAGRLCLTIEDFGTGPADESAANEGIGLRNTRQRLRALYGDGTSMALRRIRHASGDSGARVEISIPFSPMPSCAS